jgi:hypothetical protein
MGLDMYLETAWDGVDDDGPFTCYDYALEWGKANQIHGWFVRNVCGGECEDGVWYDVTRSQLASLGAVCKEIGESETVLVDDFRDGVADGEYVRVPVKREALTDTSLAERLLPVMSGYWFGSQSYDWLYLWEVRRTARMIEELLDETPPDVYFSYMASW